MSVKQFRPPPAPGGAYGPAQHERTNPNTMAFEVSLMVTRARVPCIDSGCWSAFLYPFLQTLGIGSCFRQPAENSPSAIKSMREQVSCLCSGSALRYGFWWAARLRVSQACRTNSLGLFIHASTVTTSQLVNFASRPGTSWLRRKSAWACT